ncbi:MAG TPA: FadR/GntR family transcriptional regulator [Anaerovoracaceae bacterium]|nr:FadR/GntR family transcriptional regulator [Anaerovoracaceae bacterium]
MTLQSIDRQNISEMAFEQIKGMIWSGEWKPGDKLPAETELAKTMGISRVTIRAALQKLSSLGLIERRQGSGTVVCDPGNGRQINGLVPMLVLMPPTIRAMNEYRMIFECGTAELAASRCDDEIIRRLEENLTEMELLRDANEDTAAVDVEFHYIIAEATQNPLIIKTMEVMKDSFMECMRTYKRLTDVQAGFYYHRHLIEALKNRDAFGARKLMEESLRKNQTDMDRALAETDPSL